MSSKRSASPDDKSSSTTKRQRLEPTAVEESLQEEKSASIARQRQRQRQRQHSSRSDSSEEDNMGEDKVLVAAVETAALTQHAASRSGFQRSIALALHHVGFDSASPPALESFTSLVETYLKSVISDAKSLAIASRREQPVASDFEATLERYNLPISSLKPHLRTPISLADLAPTYDCVQLQGDDAYTTLPLLSTELSGRADKEEKQYIPSNYPDFPSRHTYRFTPPDDASARDSKKTREEAARTAQHGEDALRRLVRASKMRKQKEAKSLVERDHHGRERFRLWETTMKRFMGAESRGESSDALEVADRSMIINGDVSFWRKEVPRAAKRSAGARVNKS